LNSLAIDTSTGLLMICARKDEKTASLTLRHGLQHSPRLIPLIDGLLSELSMSVKDLSLLVCSLGPGSFTGIRIGLATAKGISMGASCPVVGVSSLDAYALPYSSFQGDVYPVIDARKGNFYTALFRHGRRIGEYLDIPPKSLVEKLLAADSALLAGPEAGDVHSALFSGTANAGVSFSGYADPSALLEIGERLFALSGADPSLLVPIYLRKSEAEITAGRVR
jgi:tRNA threonylcarbamoyladenosine biosynthesis protein TsaB